MTEIFLSHSPSDGKTAAKLAAVFERQNWSVWWDGPAHAHGAGVRAEAEGQFAGTKAVVILWSGTAFGAPLIQEVLKRAGNPRLVPVLVSYDSPLPPEFRAHPFIADLTGWKGSASDARLEKLLRHVGGLLGREPNLAPEPREVADAPAPAGKPVRRRRSGQSRQRPRAAHAPAARPTYQRPGGGAWFRGIFISYRRGDATIYAGRLYDRLTARFGKERVFLDVENVGWGENFVEAITAAAESCSVMLALIGREWARGPEAGPNDYVRLEVATALRREVQVMPILIQGASMPAPSELPKDLVPLLGLNAPAISDTRWERDVEDLIEAISKLH